MDILHLSSIETVCLFTYCFTHHSRICHFLIADEGLQNLSLCLTLRAFDQGGIVLWHWASDFAVSSKAPPHSVASCGSNPDPHGSH
jgi:hypothetical protein